MNFSFFEPTYNNSDHTITYIADIYPVELLVSNFTISAVVIILNSVFIITFLHRENQSSPSSLLLLSLSICDIMRGTGIALVLVAELNLDFKFPESPAAVAYRIFVDIFNAFTIKSSLIHLCGITGDRFIALSRSYTYKSIVSRSRVKRFIYVGWVVAFFAATIQLAWLYPILDNSTDDLLEMSKFDIIYSIISFILFLALPTIVLGTIFINMFTRIRKIMSKIEDSTQMTFYKASRKQLRILNSFFMMYLCFTVLVVPYFSLRLYIDVKMWTGEGIHIHPSVFAVAYMCKNVTSILNPLLYIGRCQKFRKESKELLCGCFGPLRRLGGKSPNVKIALKDDFEMFEPRKI